MLNFHPNPNEYTLNEPITIGGWYEHADGTVGKYLWIDGRIRLSVVATSWREAQTYDRQLLTELPPVNYSLKS